MALNDTLEQLKVLGNEKVRAHNTKDGAGDNQFGVSLGEKLGIYRDFPVSKSCTSPFAPIRIDAMVNQQGSDAWRGVMKPRPASTSTSSIRFAPWAKKKTRLIAISSKDSRSCSSFLTRRDTKGSALGWAIE